MSEEGQALSAAAIAASGTPAARLAGVSNALRLLASWVLSIEIRLEALKNGNS